VCRFCGWRITRRARKSDGNIDDRYEYTPEHGEIRKKCFLWFKLLLSIPSRCLVLPVISSKVRQGMCNGSTMFSVGSFVKVDMSGSPGGQRRGRDSLV
jgi:hypothetical protein